MSCEILFCTNTSFDQSPVSLSLSLSVPQANGEEESGFTGKRFNSKMTVYSGTKTAYLPKMMSLYEQCLRVLQNNIDCESVCGTLSLSVSLSLPRSLSISVLLISDLSPLKQN